MAIFKIALSLLRERFLFLVFLNPLACIDECFNPRCNFVGTVRLGIETALPWEDGTLKVRHHSQMTTVGRSNSGNSAWRAVGVGGIGLVGVLSYNIILISRFGQIELALSVSNPDTKT